MKRIEVRNLETKLGTIQLSSIEDLDVMDAIVTLQLALSRLCDGYAEDIERIRDRTIGERGAEAAAFQMLSREEQMAPEHDECRKAVAAFTHSLAAYLEKDETAELPKINRKDFLRATSREEGWSVRDVIMFQPLLI